LKRKYENSEELVEKKMSFYLLFTFILLTFEKKQKSQKEREKKKIKKKH